MAVHQIFSTSSEADLDPRLVDAVIHRSAPGGTGTALCAGRTVVLLVCGENNTLRNMQTEGNTVSVRHHPRLKLFEHADIVCNGAHTIMGNWGKLDRRFEYLSRKSRIALYCTNCNSASWRTSCRIYLNGRRIATGDGVDVTRSSARLFVDSHGGYRAVTLDLDSGK